MLSEVRFVYFIRPLSREGCLSSNLQLPACQRHGLLEERLKEAFVDTYNRMLSSCYLQTTRLSTASPSPICQPQIQAIVLLVLQLTTGKVGSSILRSVVPHANATIAVIELGSPSEDDDSDKGLHPAAHNFQSKFYHAPIFGKNTC